MQRDSPLAIVQSWQDAANARDVDRLLDLSNPDIEMIGPRGSGPGHQMLRDWIGRAGLRLETRRVFVRGDAVVLAQHGVWRSVETGEVTGEADLASRFRVHGQCVVQFARHDSLDAALADAGLDYSDESRQS